MRNVICFDLEGPLSPQDNAYEVMGLLPQGHRIFEVLSKYDDILTLEERPGYEPGDTLSLIVPFLIRHRLTEEDIRKVSDTALIVPGVPETIKALDDMGSTAYIISTSYEQHAHNIAEKIGIPKERVYCTHLPLKRFVSESDKEGFGLVDDIEQTILTGLHPNLDDEAAIKKALDRFFWTDLPKTSLGKSMAEVKVIGGQRKVDSAIAAAKRHGLSLGDIMAVGDSITDYKMLSEVDKAGGLSVAFNANQYSIPYATIGLSSLDMRIILIIVKAFMEGGRKKALEITRECEEKGIPEDYLKQKATITPMLHVLEGAGEKKHKEVLALHKITRSAVRGAAAKLG